MKRVWLYGFVITAYFQQLRVNFAQHYLKNDTTVVIIIKSNAGCNYVFITP